MMGQGKQVVELANSRKLNVDEQLQRAEQLSVVIENARAQKTLRAGRAERAHACIYLVREYMAKYKADYTTAFNRVTKSRPDLLN